MEGVQPEAVHLCGPEASAVVGARLGSWIWAKLTALGGSCPGLRPSCGPGWCWGSEGSCRGGGDTWGGFRAEG